MDKRNGDRYAMNYDTASVVYALVDYVKTVRETPPNYTVRVTLNGKSVQQVGMTKDALTEPPAVITVIGDDLPTGEPLRIELVKDGVGRCHYSATVRYVLADENIRALSNGLQVTKKLFRIVRKNGKEQPIPLRGNLSPGETVRVSLKIRAKQDCRHMVLVDPLPSGFEVIRHPTDYYDWRYWWVGQQVRDDCVEFLMRELSEREMEITYDMRPEHAGSFHVMPAQAYGMYLPEINGRSEEIRLQVRE